MTQNKDAGFELLIDGLALLHSRSIDADAQLINLAITALIELQTAKNLADSMLELQERLIARHIDDRDHWKANHDAQVERARILHERPDLPLERVSAYAYVKKMESHVLQLSDSNEALQDMLDTARAELDTLRDRLGVSIEPHQSLYERMLDAARAVGVR